MDEGERRWKAESDLHSRLRDWTQDRFTWSRRLGPDEYQLASEEELPVAFRDDDTLLILRREDGRLFEADIWVELRPVPVKPAEEEKG